MWKLTLVIKINDSITTKKNVSIVFSCFRVTNVEIYSSFFEHPQISLSYLEQNRFAGHNDSKIVVFGNENKTTNSELFRYVVTRKKVTSYHGSTLETSLAWSAFDRVIMYFTRFHY